MRGAAGSAADFSQGAFPCSTSRRGGGGPVLVSFLVRKHRPKAAPAVVQRNGSRLTLPIDTTIDEFRNTVQGEPGRYRLLVLDDHGQPIEDVPEAHVEIDLEPSPAFSVAADPTTATRVALAKHPTELLLAETMRANTELARSVIDRIPDMMKAAAYLLQAADGAGLPRRRPPMIVWDDSDDAPEPAPPPPPNLLATFLQAAAATNGNLGGLLGLMTGKSTAAPAPLGPPPAGVPAAPLTPDQPRNAAACNAPRPADPQAHLLAILEKLTAAERAFAERVFVQLSPPAVQQWHELLLSMSVDDAVAMIRSKAAGQEA